MFWAWYNHIAYQQGTPLFWIFMLSPLRTSVVYSGLACMLKEIPFIFSYGFSRLLSILVLTIFMVDLHFLSVLFPVISGRIYSIYLYIENIPRCTLNPLLIFLNILWGVLFLIVFFHK